MDVREYWTPRARLECDSMSPASHEIPPSCATGTSALEERWLGLRRKRVTCERALIIVLDSSRVVSTDPPLNHSERRERER